MRTRGTCYLRRSDGTAASFLLLFGRGLVRQRLTLLPWHLVSAKISTLVLVVSVLVVAVVVEVAHVVRVMVRVDDAVREVLDPLCHEQLALGFTGHAGIALRVEQIAAVLVTDTEQLGASF